MKLFGLLSYKLSTSFWRLQAPFLSFSRTEEPTELPAGPNLQEAEVLG